MEMAITRTHKKRHAVAANRSLPKRVSDSTLRKLTKSLLIVAIVVTAVLAYYATANAVNPLLILWVCLPYAVLYLPLRLATNRQGLLTAFGTSLALFGLSTAVYVDGLVLNRSALNVIGLYTFPILGLVIAAAAALIVWALRSRAASASDT